MMAGAMGHRGDLKDTHAGPGAAGERRISAGAPGGTTARLLPDDAATGEQLSPQRGPGRPKGSRNIRTEATAQRLVETYGDPLEADVAIGTMPIGELVTLLRTVASDRGMKLGMSIGDIVKWQQPCRSNALPYIHAKRAATDEKGETVTPVIMFGTLAQVASGEGQRSIEAALEGDFKLVKNQWVSDDDAGKSDGEKSD